MHKLLLLLLIIFSGCGSSAFDDIIHKKGEGPTPATTDLKFSDYIASFEDDFSVTVNVPIVFGDITNDAVGVCKKWSNGYNEINIKLSYWDTINDKQKEQLIYHELGHCTLNLGHNGESVIMNGVYCPMSIMRPWAFSSYEITKCYEYDRGHYIQEMM